MMAQLPEQWPNPSPYTTQGPSTTNDAVSLTGQGSFGGCYNMGSVNILLWLSCVYTHMDYIPYGLHPRGTITSPKMIKSALY